MPPKIPRFLLSFFTLTTLLATPGAYALVLGEIRSSSRLGEFLHAEIEVEEDASDRFEASCVKLYRPAQANKDLPWITEGRLSFRRENGKGKLFISADRPVLDPVVQIGIQSSCAGVRIWRDYVLLVSPHVVTGRDLPVVQSAPAISSKPIDHVSAATRSTREAKPEAGAAGASKGRSKPATAEPMLRLSAGEIAAPASHSLHTSAGAIRIVEAVLPLRMSTELRLSVSSTDLERELLRLEYRVLTELHNQAESQLALSEQLRRLESSAGELKAAHEHLGAAGGSAAPAPVALIVPVEKPESKVALEAAPPETADDSANVLLYVVLGASLLFLLLLIMRRRRASQMAELFEPTHAPTIIVEHSEFSRPPRQVNAVRLGDDAANNALPLVPAAVSQSIPPPPENLEATPVMELAEIMLSFGRISGAAQTLQEFIEANPKVALQPWMRLLEIYRDSGMRADFEALATNLNQNFNVEVVHWDAAAPGERVEMSLELLPHIRDQIDALWGKPECLEYLQQLLRDNRDGQRTGFTLPVVKEILLLIDLMVAEKAATK